MADTFTLHLRRRKLALDADQHTIWQPVDAERPIAADKLAIIICDMWDRHWSRGATERVAAMVGPMNRVLHRARDAGATIIHAPSETMDFYAASPARQRMLDLPPFALAAPPEHADPPLPIDDSDEGSDTGETQTWRAWTRQHPALDIDEARDGISDDGREIFADLRRRRIEQVVLMGVHTNMCVLNRSFAIKALVGQSFDVALARDLTDSMYNPAMRPYVSHDDGTRLVVEYIEKFWCPTILSDDLMQPSRSA